MSNTKPGGVYLSPDRKTWHDAEGERLTVPKPDVADAGDAEAGAEKSAVATPASPPKAVRRKSAGQRKAPKR